MSANLPRRRRSAGNKQALRRREDGEARLWRIGLALTVSFSVAVVGLAGLASLAWVLLGVAGYRRHGAPPLHDAVGVAQLVFATVAGAGALVALVVAYRRQKVAEADSSHDRIRVFNERFTTIASQLGDAQAAVRLAGVHAMAGLADDWKENRQTCVDVLCAYLRLPSDANPGDGTAHAANREIRYTITRLISAHLRPKPAVSWQGLDFDFTGVRFEGPVDFTDAEFSGGRVRFDGAEFSGGEVRFDGAEFSGGEVRFDNAKFSGGEVRFDNAKFSGSEVRFDNAKFSGSEVSFDGAEFSRQWISFSGAEFSDGEVRFVSAEFSGSAVHFVSAEFSGSRVIFDSAEISSGEVGFRGAKFSGSRVSFNGVKFFPGGEVYFSGAEFSRNCVSFSGASFSGGEVYFLRARFSGSQIDLKFPADWSHPPVFAWGDKAPPPGVQLPTSDDLADGRWPRT